MSMMKAKNYKSDHALEILTELNNDRIKMKSYCDITLTAESTGFSGHKCILGVFSTFFSKMFSIEMKEKYERKGDIQGVTEETLEAVLNFIYTGDITITNENVYDFIEAANYLGIPRLEKFCEDFLLEAIDVTNCLRIRACSSLYDLDTLIKKADLIITEHFESLVLEKEFSKWRYEDIKEMLEREDKHVSSEEIVFHGLMQWIKYDVDARKKHLTDLFSLVKLESLSSDFLQDVVGQEDLIMKSQECMKLCFQSTVSQLRIQQHNQVIAEQQRAEKRFLVFSGNKGWLYDIKNKKTSVLPNTMFDHSNGSVVSYKKKVYILGGSQTKAVERFDFNDQVSGWLELTTTVIKRDAGASTVFNGCIYSCGGWNDGGWNAQRSGQCYNIRKDKWIMMNNLKKGRSYFALVSTTEGIYAIGGWNNNVALKVVEFHNLRRGGWTTFPSMKVGRYGLAVVVLDGKLYAIGGWNQKKLKSVECYDPLNRNWCHVAKMNFARVYHGACVVKGQIYVAGGGAASVEVYDPDKNVWEIEESIPEFRSVQFIVDI